jgi:hypothetical protein
MISLVFLLGVLGLLFLMPFAANRRFGVLGLGLAAGSLLSTNWTGTVTPFIEQQGVVLVAPPLAIVVATALVLLPPTVLLLGGPSYAKMWQRIVGSLAFAVLGLAFLVDHLSLMLQLDSFGQVLINTVATYDSLIIVVGIIAALGDMLLTGKHSRKNKKD